jgi:NCAIR mutase (PurE)-related protein
MEHAEDFANLDLGREARTGFPEVVFCEGKTPEQVLAIVKRLAGIPSTFPVVGTRASEAHFAAVRKVLPEAKFHEAARIISVPRPSPALPASPASAGTVAVLSAGTTDIPIAEEAAVLSELYGCEAKRHYDIGVAGIDRLLSRLGDIRKADAVVAVAGMDGALPSVVSGLVDMPVIACPTSVGYGASMGGISALLTMLNSCALGVAVVNIDNGIGAGHLAAMIARAAHGGGNERSKNA